MIMRAEEFNDRDEHPRYPVSDWAEDVALGETRLGYRAWVEHQCRQETEAVDYMVAVRFTAPSGLHPNLLQVFVQTALKDEVKRWSPNSRLRQIDPGSIRVTGQTGLVRIHE